jgi:hypothetical protein
LEIIEDIGWDLFLGPESLLFGGLKELIIIGGDPDDETYGIEVVQAALRSGHLIIMQRYLPCDFQ